MINARDEHRRVRYSVEIRRVIDALQERQQVENESTLI